MSNSNARKDTTLGMPHGTANGRLRKIILFYLLKKHGENICFKCSKIIERVEDLSIEHKKPWEGISAELYWDIENVAFSHLRCNRPDRPYSPPVKFRDGFGWCSRCKTEKSEDKFHKNSSTLSGLNSECKICKSELNALRDRRKIDESF